MRIKHWQLFLLTWGFPIILQLVTFTDPRLMIKMFPIMIFFCSLGNLGWIWAIGTQLQLPANVKLEVRRFRIFFSIPIVYISLMTIFIAYKFYGGLTGEGSHIGVLTVFIFCVHFGASICMLLGIRFAAKTMRSVELQREANFGDYSGEFFLIWFSIIGFWVLQPRLNKLLFRRS